MKKTTAILLVLAMLLQTAVIGLSVFAAGQEITLHRLPEADLVDLRIADGKIENLVTGEPWKNAKVNEYASGTSGAAEDFTHIKDINVILDGQTYTMPAFVKTTGTNTVGIDLSAYKADLTGALSAGFTMETAFTVPEKKTSSTAIIGATSGGGFGLFQLATGEIEFEVGSSSGGYKDLVFTDTFKAGDFVHLVCVFNGSKLTAFANGRPQGELAIPGFRAGGYFGAIGIGGSTASATNYTNFACNPNATALFRLYSKAFSAKQAGIAYASFKEGLTLAADTKQAYPKADILDITFGSAGVVSGGANVLGTPVITEWASSGNPKENVVNVKPVRVTAENVLCNPYGFVKSSTTNVLTADLSANKAGLTAALNDGFTVEAAFILPASSSTSVALFGATNGGGVGLFFKNNNFIFEMGNSSGGYADLTTASTFKEGDYVHFVGVFTGSKLVAYYNGVRGGEIPAAGFRAGSYHGMVGLGATISSLTNPTNYACPEGYTITCFRLYNTPMTEENMVLSYQYHLASLGEDAPFTKKADIVDLVFGDKSVKDVSTAEVVGTPVLTEYSSGKNARPEYTNFGDVTVTVDGKNYTVKGFYKNSGSPTNTIMVDFSAVTEGYKAAMNDGFSLETAFVMPVDRGSSGRTTWGSAEGHAIIGATSGGGFVLGRNEAGNLFFAAHNGSGYTAIISADTFADGAYLHAVAVFDKAAEKLLLYVNGKLEGSASFASIKLGDLPSKYVGIGGSLAGATNPTNFACAAPFYLTAFRMYNDPLTASDAAGAYRANLRAIGAELLPETEEDEPESLGDDILSLFFADGTLLPTEYSVGKPRISEFSGSGAAKAGFPGVKTLDAKIGEDTVRVRGFVNSGTSNQIGIDFGSYKSALEDEMKDGFSVEISFVLPEGLDTAERYLLGATNAGGFGIYTKDGKLLVCFHDGAWKTIGTALPEAGSYVHAVLSYDQASGQIFFYVNGEKVGSALVSKFNPGGWFGAMGLCGSTASALNYTKYPMPAGTAITGLHLYSDALDSAQVFGAYEKDLARFGYEVTKRVFEDDFEPVLRFMVTSDVHISSEGDARCGKLANALGDIYEIARTSGNHYDRVDAVAFVGDIGDNGRENQQTWFRNICDAGIDYRETQLLMQTGNHDYYEGNSRSDDPRGKEAQFDQIFAFTGANPSDNSTLVSTYRGIYNSHFIIGGYHFISLTPANQGWHYNADDIAWFDRQLAQAAEDTGADKPIFVFHHIGNLDTVIGTDSHASDTGVNELESTLRKYPQVVDFSGHSHQPINNECSIHQKYYTSLGTGTLNYTSQPYVDGAKVPMLDQSIYDIAQVYVVEVDAEQRVRVRVYDIIRDQFMSTEWIIDSFDPEEFKYTEDRLNDEKIFFAEDAAIGITAATQNLVSFRFPVTPAESYPASVFRIVIEDMAGNPVKERSVGWAYYGEDYSTVLGTAIGGLAPETQYRMKIYGINPLYVTQVGSGALVSENCLETTFTTAPVAEGEPVADILDVSLSTEGEKVKDISANGMKATVNGSPEVAYDESIGMNAITFASNGQTVKLDGYAKQADSMSYSFAVEAYFKINEYNCESGSKAPLGSEQSGGFGFDMYDNGTVAYSVYTGGYKTAQKTQEVGKYYHWVGSYDGEYLTVYVNGHKIARLNAPAPITYNSIAAQVFYLGADTTGAGNPERQSRSSIALARIYSLPLSDEQALALWENVRAKQDTELYPDDSSDPEYLFWENIDDADTDYVTFITPDGTQIHDHANDHGNQQDVFKAGAVGYFTGSHLFRSTCHYITGDMQCKLNFTGTAFRYVLYYRGPVADGYGQGVDVYIDGEFYQTVTGINGNNLTSRFVALEVTGLKDKKHEITFVSHDKIRVIMDAFDIVKGTGREETGEPIPPVSFSKLVDAVDTEYLSYYAPDGTYCDVDGLKTDGAVEPGGNWQFFCGSHLQNKTGIFGNYVKGVAAELKFSGTGVRLITQYRGPNTADIDVYIDGELVQTVTGLSADNDTSSFTVFDSGRLEDGIHTLVLVAANGGQMPIDYLEVDGDPIASTRSDSDFVRDLNGFTPEETEPEETEPEETEPQETEPEETEPQETEPQETDPVTPPQTSDLIAPVAVFSVLGLIAAGGVLTAKKKKH